MVHGVAIWRGFAGALIALAVWTADATAYTPGQPRDLEPVVTEDPDAFARDLAERMTREGVEPLRALLREVGGTPIDPQNEGLLNTYRDAIEGRTAIVSQEVADVMLSGVVRRIYYYHAYEEIAVFVRLEFVKGGENSWYLNLILYGGTWDMIAGLGGPNFLPTAEAE